MHVDININKLIMARNIIQEERNATLHIQKMKRMKLKFSMRMEIQSTLARMFAKL